MVKPRWIRRKLLNPPYDQTSIIAYQQYSLVGWIKRQVNPPFVFEVKSSLFTSFEQLMKQAFFYNPGTVKL